MDAFFASVELLAHPEWRGKPLVVGSGPHERGVVSTCSYEARKYGIRSAMPSRNAYRLCPHAIFTAPNMELYESVSRKAFEIFEHYTPYVEAVSIDEAFLDITGSLHHHGGAAALGEALRKEIKSECGVTCSVGIAPNRLLAKIGSEENKPDGLTIMPSEPEKIAAFLSTKPVSTLWGVGKKTEEILRTYGILLCGDIQRTDTRKLASILRSETGAKTLRDFSFGISDDSVHTGDDGEKSVSAEYTFSDDESDRNAVLEKLLELVAKTGRRFRTRERWAMTAKIKLRNARFETLSRQMSFKIPSRDDIMFRKNAIALFNGLWPANESTRNGERAVRLIGFTLANIRESANEGDQLHLFETDDERQRKKRENLSEALDRLHNIGLIG